MRVFISSVIAGYEPFRDAVEAAVTTLGHEVIRAEDFGASTGTPQQACLGGVRAADLIVLLVGARYGEIQASGQSATEEEYREARESKDMLVFVEEIGGREAAQEALLTEIRSWADGHLTGSFTDPGGLRNAVTRQLHELQISRQAGPIDPEEILARAMGLVPDADRGGHKDTLVLAVAGGPRQSILRPADIESTDLQEDLHREAQFGEHRVLDRQQGTEWGVRGDALVLDQADASVYLDEEGSVRVSIPARAPDSDALPAIIHEEVVERLERAIGYVGLVLGRVDPSNRLSRVAVVADLQGGGYFGWRTRAEDERNPGSLQMNLSATEGAVGLLPPDRARGALRANAREIAEDLAIRLRRKRGG